MKATKYQDIPGNPIDRIHYHKGKRVATSDAFIPSSARGRRTGRRPKKNIVLSQDGDADEQTRPAIPVAGGAVDHSLRTTSRQTANPTLGEKKKICPYQCELAELRWSCEAIERNP